MVSWAVFYQGKTLSGVHTIMDNLFTNVEENNFKLTTYIMDGILKDCYLITDGKLPGRVFMFAHNSGLFDLHVVIQSLVKLHYNESGLIPTIITDNSNDIFALTMAYKDVEFTFYDSMKVLPMSLKAVRKNLLKEGDEKLAVHHDNLRDILMDDVKRAMLNQP